MHTTILPLEHPGMFRVAVFDTSDDIVPLDFQEEVPYNMLTEVVQRLKRENYTVQAYLEEFLRDIQCSNERVKAELETFEMNWGEHRTMRYTYRYTFQRTINDKKVVASMTVGTSKDAPIDYSEVLELWLDDGFSVSNRGKDLAGRKEWIDDLGWKENSQTITSWNTTWRVWEQLKKLLTQEELDLVKHAFEEGRRR